MPQPNFLFWCDRYPLGGLAQGRVVQMNKRLVVEAPTVAEQAPSDVQALPIHDRVRGVGMTQVVEPRVRTIPAASRDLIQK